MADCFDYLRQSLMCCGDTALEGGSEPESFPEGIVGTDGWGVQHVCKTYADINVFANEHRAFDLQDI